MVGCATGFATGGFGFGAAGAVGSTEVVGIEALDELVAAGSDGADASRSVSVASICDESAVEATGASTTSAGSSGVPSAL